MEYLDLCDEKGIPAGKIISRQIAHREGLLHRTSHVWIIRKNNDEIEVYFDNQLIDANDFNDDNILIDKNNCKNLLSASGFNMDTYSFNQWQQYW